MLYILLARDALVSNRTGLLSFTLHSNLRGDTRLKGKLKWQRIIKQWPEKNVFVSLLCKLAVSRLLRPSGVIAAFFNIWFSGSRQQD